MIEEFTKYYQTFDNVKEIKFKYDHSIRVMNLSVAIAKNLNMNDEQLEVVKLIGLLHDYSRFEQWNKYKTYNDLNSFDHANRTVELLFDKKQIEKYHLKKQYYNIVYDAIKNHNKYDIDKVNEESLIYCKIIRDADKLDIISNFAISIFYKYDVDNAINKNIIEQFFQHHLVKKTKDINENEKLVIQIALIYDLNFSYSYQYIKENNIIDKMEKQVSEKTFKKYFDEIKKYMEELC